MLTLNNFCDDEATLKQDECKAHPTFLTFPHSAPHLVDVSPVLVVFKSFPEHCHNLIAGYRIVGKIRNVSHLRAGGAPWVIGCCFSHLKK